MSLSWRRFRVLFLRGWKLTPRDDDQDFDWRAALDKAQGRETPSNVVRMTPDEYVRKVSG